MKWTQAARVLHEKPVTYDFACEVTCVYLQINCPFSGLSGKLRPQTQMLHSAQAPVNLSTHITADIITRATLQSIASIQIRYYKPAQEDIFIDKQLKPVASCVASS
jgi:hypothetical protein